MILKEFMNKLKEISNANPLVKNMEIFVGREISNKDGHLLGALEEITEVKLFLDKTVIIKFKETK